MESSPACDLEHLACRAEQIYADILRFGPRQVRICGAHILSYKYPAPRGYGVRGVLVGVYGKNTMVGWIVEDLVSLIDRPDSGIGVKQE
jgi:hypothetical protein